MFNLPLIQSPLHHANPGTTAKYIHRVNSVQMAAQEKFLEAIKFTGAVASRLGPKLGLKEEVGEAEKSAKLLK